MTTREDFEKWFSDSYGIDISIDRAGEGYIYDQINDKWIGYQACAAHYEAKIALYEAVRLYDEAPDDAYFEPPHPIFQLAQERDNYADQVRNLIALIAEKDKALKCVKAQLIDGKIFTAQLHQRPYWRYEVEEALSLTHDSVKLKEVSTVNSVAKGDESWLVVSDTLQEPVGIDRGTKLYTIVKGEAG